MTIKYPKPMIKNESMNRYGPLVGAIDEGTSNVRFMVCNIIIYSIINFLRAIN